MSITWSDIQNWDPAHLNNASQSLSTLRQTLTTEADTGANLTKAPVSSGTAFTTMMSNLGTLNGDLDQLVAEVSELMMATSEAADGVWDVQTKVFECTSYAEARDYLTINSDGSVTCETIPSLGSPAADVSQAREDKTRRDDAKALADLIQAALDRAVEVDNAYNKRLTAVNNGTYTSTETASSASQGLPDLPQEGWSPTEVATWWSSLTQAEQDQIIAEHPETIGNLDGVSMTARDKANRNILLGPDGTGGQVIRDAEAELARVQAEYDNAPLRGHPGVNPYEDELRAAQQRVDDLHTLRDLVTNADTDYSLVSFDASGSGDVRAAVAIGDVDTATNVSTLVPGISTTVRQGLTGLAGDAATLQQAAGGNTATIAWLGYDAPPGFPVSADQKGSAFDITSTATANEGAEALNGFHEGIHAYHQTQGRDPYLTTVDHSYGSLTAGTAARDTKVGVLDAMTLYGSPGGRAHDASEYNIPEGKVYASANSGDWVVGLGPDWSFGKEPTEMPGVTEISSNDGGHSDYWDNPEFVEDVAQIVRGEDPKAK